MNNSDYWMRAVSFAGLHRLLCCLNDASDGGMTAGEIDALVRRNQIKLTRQAAPPARTTLYHYRNTLLRLDALRREGSTYRINRADSHVRTLLRLPPPLDDATPLGDSAKEHFSALVLRNPQCVSLFFGLFLPYRCDHSTVEQFRDSALPVHWTRHSRTDISISNPFTGRTLRCASPVSITAVPYGIRYWARDELELIDEYWSPPHVAAVMFSLQRPPRTDSDAESLRDDTIRLVLSWRTERQWSSFSISDLISRACRERRQPRIVLFDTLDWLVSHWPHHTIPVPTTRGLATLTASSPQKERLVLRSYFRSADGRYISHIRLHRDIVPPSL